MFVANINKRKATKTSEKTHLTMSLKAQVSKSVISGGLTRFFFDLAP